MKSHILTASAVALAASLAGAAHAQTPVTATTDLNVRSGPGPQYPVVGVIGANQGATLDGCLEGSKWCRVAFSGGDGWAFSDYLTADAGGTAVIVTERPASVEVPVVTYEHTAATGTGSGGAVAGAATGAVAGALIAGPLGAAVGGVAGAATGGFADAVIEPPAEVRTYITANEVDPVFLDGEVVIGAGLPETVVLREVPDYEYRYVYVNNQPVLVEPQTRRIVYIAR